MRRWVNGSVPDVLGRLGIRYAPSSSVYRSRGRKMERLRVRVIETEKEGRGRVGEMISTRAHAAPTHSISLAQPNTQTHYGLSLA